MPLAVVFKAYVKVVLLVALTEKTPLKLVFPAELVVGTPAIKTVVGMPGTMPVRVPAVVTVTTLEVSETLVMASEVEGWVTSTPRVTPLVTASMLPGVT